MFKKKVDVEFLKPINLDTRKNTPVSYTSIVVGTNAVLVPATYVKSIDIDDLYSQLKLSDETLNCKPILNSARVYDKKNDSLYHVENFDRKEFKKLIRKANKPVNIITSSNFKFYLELIIKLQLENNIPKIHNQYLITEDSFYRNIFVLKEKLSGNAVYVEYIKRDDKENYVGKELGIPTNRIKQFYLEKDIVSGFSMVHTTPDTDSLLGESCSIIFFNMTKEAVASYLNNNSSIKALQLYDISESQ